MATMSAAVGGRTFVQAQVSSDVGGVQGYARRNSSNSYNGLQS